MVLVPVKPRDVIGRGGANWDKDNYVCCFDEIKYSRNLGVVPVETTGYRPVVPSRLGVDVKPPLTVPYLSLFFRPYLSLFFSEGPTGPRGPRSVRHTPPLKDYVNKMSGHSHWSSCLS